MPISQVPFLSENPDCLPLSGFSDRIQPETAHNRVYVRFWCSGAVPETAYTAPAPAISGGMKKSWILPIGALALLVVLLTPLGSLLHASSSGASPAASEYTGTPYMAMNGSAPVRWPACATISYEVNLTGAPSDASTNLDSALALISTYTHFTFVYQGSTTAIPQNNWTHQDLPAPLVIAWATPATSSALDSSRELSIGEVAATGIFPATHYTAGVVVIDTDATKALPSGMGTGDLGLLILHELSHAMGLAHNHNPHSYMYPYFNVTSQSVTPADQAHLASLDAGSC
jgi:hypothetical protein